MECPGQNLNCTQRRRCHAGRQSQGAGSRRFRETMSRKMRSSAMFDPLASTLTSKPAKIVFPFIEIENVNEPLESGSVETK